MAQILNQILYILLPIFIYFSIIKYNNNSILIKYKKTLIGVLCGLSIFLCMTFPVSFATGNIFDLRSIPWIISFLYGGLPVGLILTVSMFVYRILIGGAGMYAVFIAYSLSLVPLLFYFRNYLNFSYKKKLNSILLFTSFNTVIVVLATNYIFNFSIQSVINFYVFFIFLHLLTVFITFYLIELLKERYLIEEKILKSEKLNLVGQMAASVAHEIRNPMTTVHGFLQLMYQDDSIPLKQKEHIKVMQNELSRAETIISDYLTLAKPEADQIEVFDLKEQLKQIHQSLSPYAILNDVKIESSVEENVEFFIKGSPSKMQQVLVNMIKNAIEVSSKNSVVEVNLALNSQKAIQITIKDRGHGMSKDTLEKLGTPFYSLKSGGTGLGLTVCYRIVDSMNGNIKVESKPGVGTTFVVVLPKYKS